MPHIITPIIICIRCSQVLIDSLDVAMLHIP